jgi:hypothetical protein
MGSSISKFLLRLEADLFESLKARAAEGGISINELCKTLLKNGSSTGIFEEFVSDLNKKIGLKVPQEIIGVVLFGSAARGSATPESDRDLLIILDRSSQLSRDLYQIWDERVGSSKRHAVVLSKYTPHFAILPTEVIRTEGIWLETALDGIVLWEKDFLVSRFLSQVRHAIAERKLIRKISHGHPYWMTSSEESL